MNIYLNYSDSNYAKARDFAAEMALKKGHFDKVLSYGPNIVDEEFKALHSKIWNTSRGAGLWLWKPYIIDMVINCIAMDDDYIFYCDSGAYFVNDCKYIIDVMQSYNSDIYVFDVPLLERQFTKEQTFIGMECTEEKYRNSNQIHSTFMCFKKSPSSIEFIKKWLSYCCNYDLLSCQSTEENIHNTPDFFTHREDQSIFSLLCKKEGITPHYDPSQYALLPDWYACRGLVYAPTTHKKEYPVSIILHKTKNVNIVKIFKIKLYLLFPELIREIIAKHKLKNMGVIYI